MINIFVKFQHAAGIAYDFNHSTQKILNVDR
jgi:hypothetical protein